MAVASCPDDVRVVWRCVEGPREWLDTHFTFELHREGDGETVLLFTNDGWREPVEFMHHCTTKWASFLIAASRTSSRVPADRSRTTSGAAPGTDLRDRDRRDR